MKLSPTFLRFVAYAKRPVYFSSNVAVVSSFKTFWELYKVNLWSMLGLILLGIIFELIGEWIGIKEPKNTRNDTWLEVCAGRDILSRPKNLGFAIRILLNILLAGLQIQYSKVGIKHSDWYS